MFGRVAASALLAVLLVPMPAAVAAQPKQSALFRIDQAGYFPGQDGYAALMSAQDLGDPQVTLVDAGGAQMGRATVTDRGHWSSTYAHVYSVEFTVPAATGSYRLVLAGGVRSDSLQVVDPSKAWSTILRYGVRFDQVQRDGAEVIRGALDRQPSHLNDSSATVYQTPNFARGSDLITDADLHPVSGAEPVDVEGGWFDAGDYLKFTHSTAYADILLFTAARDLGHAAPKSVLAEAQHGIDWLDKMWDSADRTLYLQVGVGSGNRAGTFRGDHDGWRLPEADDHATSNQDRYVSHRPVFRAAAPGQKISPNLVGRVSAAFALAAQADAAANPTRAQHEYAQATSLYSMAQTKPGRLTTALPFAFYPESAWRDDMELGAVEIAKAAQSLGTGDGATYLADAAKWARDYLQKETGDTFNLYDTAALAHTELIRAMGSADLAVTKAQLIADLRRQLNGAQNHSDADPFAAGVDDTEFDVDSHTLGLIATEGWYRSVSGDDTFAPLASKLRGWVFGANAWGVSFMVGVGTTFPHCMQHQVANLSGSVNGTAPLDLGAVVNGPNGADLFDGGLDGFQDGMVHCPGTDAPPAVQAGRYDGSGSVYLDDVRSWQTDEPALDMTGAAIAASAAQLSAG